MEIAGNVPTYIAKQIIKTNEVCLYGVIPVFVGATGPKAIYSNFTLSGTLEEISKKIEEIKRMNNVDQVIFGTPICHSLESVKKLRRIIEREEGEKWARSEE